MNREQWIDSTEALLALDEKGALAPHGIGGHARTLLTFALTELRTSAPGAVKALEWRVPTDHPRDPDTEDATFCADGIGGIYWISRKQKDGPERLLFWAHDCMDWTGFNSIPEAKAAAQADYERRILSALAPSASDDAIAEPVAWEWIAAGVKGLTYSYAEAVKLSHGLPGASITPLSTLTTRDVTEQVTEAVKAGETAAFEYSKSGGGPIGVFLSGLTAYRAALTGVK